VICLEKPLKNNWLDNKWFILLLSLLCLDTLVKQDMIGWLTTPIFLILIVRYVIKVKGYGYQLYVFSVFSLLGLESLLLIYIYLFDSIILKNPANLVWFLFFVLGTILVIFLYLRLVVNGEYKKFPS
jgi:hypothetical protein